MKKSFWIVFTDPRGATKDGVWHPVTHRVFYDGTKFHGVESVVRVLSKDVNPFELLNAPIVHYPARSGSFGSINWSIE